MPQIILTVKKRRWLSKQIIEKAMGLGASLAGIAGVRDLKYSLSHKTANTACWPPDAWVAVVIGLEHKADEPEMDWWDGDHGTLGNRKLIQIAERLEKYLAQTRGILSQLVPYHDLRNELFLKDAAVLAGLGTIGRNNLLITPEFGPRVRLRALFLTVNAMPAKPIDFDPCSGCPEPCLRACPQEAFKEGSYELSLCRLQMQKDEIDSGRLSHDRKSSPNRYVKYCRACELACPIPL